VKNAHTMKHPANPLTRILLPVVLAAAPAAATLAVPATAQATAGVAGKWHTPEDGGVIEVKENSGVVTGTLVASDNPQAPLGTTILRGFTKRGDVWVGTIYAPKRGRTAEATLRLDGDKLVIEVQAGMRTKTIVWTRGS
jgi:uncharacterized protein (DUF2147 family)